MICYERESTTDEGLCAKCENSLNNTLNYQLDQNIVKDLCIMGAVALTFAATCLLAYHFG